MAWIGAITNAGARLLAEYAGGSKLTLNRAAAGAGTVEDIAILAQTGLVSEKQVASIVSSKKTDGGQRIRIQLGAAEESYTLQQIGLYAAAEEDEAVLLALFQNTQGVPVPAADESPDFLYVFNATLNVSNQVELHVTVDRGAYVTYAQLEEMLEDYGVAFSDEQPLMDGEASAGTSKAVARADHRHPVDTSRAPQNHTQAASTITAGTFAGAVVANSSGQTPGTSLLRNSKLVSTETNPTVNGEICWTYE